MAAVLGTDREEPKGELALGIMVGGRDGAWTRVAVAGGVISNAF